MKLTFQKKRTNPAAVSHRILQICEVNPQGTDSIPRPAVAHMLPASCRNAGAHYMRCHACLLTLTFGFEKLYLCDILHDALVLKHVIVDECVEDRIPGEEHSPQEHDLRAADHQAEEHPDVLKSRGMTSVLGPVHTGHAGTFACKCVCKPFDVAGKLCKHSH